MSAAARPLGRLYPKHFDHVEAFPLTPDITPAVQPVAPGTNWYTSMDDPQKDSQGRYVLKHTRIGTIRGGHCYCLCPPTLLAKDTDAFHHFFNQGQEGACEGFGHARRYAILSGKTVDAFHLYDDARRIEGTYPEGEGSTNDAVCQALKKWGLHSQIGAEAHRVDSTLSEKVIEHLTAYRWATSVEQILQVLGITDGGLIPLLNSWGDSYPHVVYMPPELLERLLREGGEVDVITDR